MKKNILSILLGAAIITTFSSCVNNQLADNDSPSTQVFKAYIENPTTKVTIDRTFYGGKIFWADKESIDVNGKTYDGTASESDKTVSTFVPHAESAVPVGGKYIATYPYNLNQGGTLTLNSTQLYQENNLAKVFPMYAETVSDTEPFAFKNICGLLEIVLKGEKKVNQISVCDSSLAMSGAFTVDENFNAVISDNSTKAKVTLDCKGTQLTEEGVKFYIAVPPATYNCLKISVLSLDGIKWTVTAKKPAEIKRSMIYSLEFTPELGSTVHEKVQLWKDGPYWATTNIGAAKPEDSGLFFSWGNVDGYLWDGTTLEGSMAGYRFVESPWYDWTHGGTIDHGSTSSPYVLKSTEDAAAVIWGNGWRMPTAEEAVTFASLDSEYNEETNSVFVWSSLDPSKYISIGLNGIINTPDGFSPSGQSVVLWTNKCRGKNNQVQVIYMTTTQKLGTNYQRKWIGANIRPVCDK